MLLSSLKKGFIVVPTLLLIAQTAFASNVGGVFGPGVKEGDQSAQYRAAYDPDNFDLVQRIHYQQALNGDVRLRGVFQGRKTGDSTTDFDFFQGELQWQLKGSDKRQHALRFDLRIRDQGRATNLGVNWTNQYSLSPTLSARLIALAVVEVGEGSRSGMLLQTRANLSQKLNDRFNLSLELFSDYGFNGYFNSFDDQTHQLGPAIGAKLTKDWSVFSGLLVGLTDASPDTSLRFRLSKRFN